MLTPEAAAALLDWYLACGVDTAVSDTPQDWSRVPDRPTAQPPSPQPAAARTGGDRSALPTTAPLAERAETVPPIQSGGAPDQEAVMAARARAAAATSLEALRAELERFEGCPLRFTARSLCFADGNPEADLMLVGEAPGKEEDLTGVPFVGRSGRLLDRMLAAIGLDRSSVYIANVIPWRPPGNRTPSPIETEICKTFITRQIELASPKLLVLLGGVSAQTLLGVPSSIGRLRGRWMDYPLGGRTIPAMAMFHPAHLLRQPREKRTAWADLLAVRDRLGTISRDD